MQSKLIILVVLAIAAQNVLEVSSTAPRRLPNKAWDILDRLGDIMNVIIFQQFTVVRNFFNTVRNCTEQAITGELVDTQPLNTAEARIRLKISVDNFLTATSIAAGQTCATCETVRNALYEIVEVVIQLLKSSFDSAKTGNYPDNKTEIENYKTQLRDAFQSFAQNIVDLIESCLNPDSREDVEEVIQTVADGMQTSFDLLVDYLFNAIDIYAAAVCFDTSVELDSALTGIDSNRVNGLTALGGVLAYFFGGIESLYLDRVLGQTEILMYLYPGQYAEKATLILLNDTYGIIATTNAHTLEERTGVKEFGRLDYYPATLANQSGTSIDLQRAINVALRGVKESQPISTPKVVAVELTVPVVSNVLATTWFGSIELADDNGLLCGLIPAAIEATAVSQYPAVVAFTTSLFVAVSNSLTVALEDVVSMEGISILKDTINHGYTANNYIYKGSQYLSRIICTNRGVTQADFVKIRTLLLQTTLNMIQFTKNVFKTNLIQILTNYGYY